VRGSRFGLRAGSIAAVAALAILAIVFRAPLLRAGVAGLLDAFTGTRVAFGSLDLRGGSAVARDVTVTRGGEPLLAARRVEVRYSLRDVLPGGARRYGLISVALNGPTLTIVRRADGSLNVAVGAPAPSSPPGPAAPAPAAPWNLRVSVAGGRVLVLDPNRVLPDARRLSLDGVAARAALSGASTLRYAASGEVAGDRAQRFTLAGRVDETGYALHRLRARALAVAPLANYFINTPSARFESGYARDVDVRAYAFAGPDGSAPYHFAGSAELEGGTMRVPSFVPDARAMRGRIDLYDDGLIAPHLRASVAGADVDLAGGLYDWSAPAFRLGIRTRATPLAALRTLFAFSRRLPLTGTAQLASLVEGAVGAPLVATTFASPALAYGNFPIAEASGRVTYYDGSLAVIGARGRYGGLDVAADGAIDLGEHTNTQLVTDVAGPASRVPYLAQAAPAATADVVALLSGVDLRFDARGTVAGAGGGAQLDGTFHLDPLGDGTFGPFSVTRPGGSLAGAYFLQRSTSRSGFWLQADDYPLALVPGSPHLPGIDLAPPDFRGRLSGAVAGTGPPSAFRIAGRVRASAFAAGPVRIDDLAADLAGSLENVRLGGLRARGPWGAFTGAGAYVGGRLALDGRYDGSFERLAAFTGNLGAAGPLHGPVALEIGPASTLVQAEGELTPGARVRGVPLDRLDGTLSVAGSRLRVYAANAALAGGTFAAAGTLDRPGGLEVSVAGVRPERLSALAPFGPGGRIAAIGRATYAARRLHFEGGLAVGGGATVARLPLAASGDLSVSGTRADLSATDALLDGAAGSLAGSVTALGTSQARYDVGVHVAAAPLAPLAQLFLPHRSDIAGTIAADVRLTGRAASARLAGDVAVPEGTVNGLAFRDGSTRIEVDEGGVRARDGRVTVGSTDVAFGATVRGDDTAIRLDAPHADLSDFNDYFDAGDTLGGRGRIAARFHRSGRSVRTNADLAIARLRYRRFDLGDARARWSSGNSKVAGSLGFGGPSGTLDVAGTLRLAARAPLREMLGRSAFDGTASLRALDLGVWLPALGYQLPLAGRVDADAKIAGLLRDPDVTTTGTLANGSIGRFPVERFDFGATSTLSRTTVTRAELQLPSLAVVATGSFGLNARDPLALAVHAKSDDVGAFANRLVGAKFPLSGTAEADVKIDGTTAKPHVAGGFDVENASLRAVAIPRALGEFSVRGRDVVLSDVEVGFATGTLYFAGSVPLEFAPFDIGPAKAPITLELAAKGVDLGDFAPLLPAGSTLKGVLDGRVAVGGTASDPRLRGALALTGATVQSPLETVPLTGVAAALSFSGKEATLERLHADAGGGSLDVSGHATFGSLVRPAAGTAYDVSARAAGLRLAFPAYGSGQVDGTLRLARASGAPPLASGSLALDDATIPFSALLLAGSGPSSGFDASAAAHAAPAAAPATALGFDLDVSADRNVRVRSANVDIGGRGAIHVGGNIAAPQISGGFTSTGGTIAYFNTVFRVIDGTVTFAPDAGVIPNLNATAVTHVSNPDTNRVRNAAGTADVTLTLTGPVTNLSIALASDPPYDREQILGLLLSAPALGASNLFGTTNQSPTLYGSTAPGNLAVRNSNGQFSVAQEAFGIANAQFTRALLAPIESTFASYVGLSSLNVNVDFTGSVGLSARKVLGKKVNALYGTTFSYPYRQTFGFEFKPDDNSAAQVTVFETLGAEGLTSLAPTSYITATNQRLQAAQPAAGTAGFSLSLQRFFP